MEVTMRTGTTKSVSGASLVSLPFTSVGGEQCCFLLNARANPRDAKTLEEECSTIIRHALLGTDGDAWHRLDGTLKELNGLIKGFLVSETVDDVHALLAIVDKEGMLHVSHAGRAEAYLIRAGVTNQITEANRGKPLPMFVHISSGPVEPRDTVVFSTLRVLRTVTPAQMVQMATRGDQLMEEIVVRLDDEKEASALAILYVPANRERVIEESPVASRLSSLPSRRSARGRDSRGTSTLTAVTAALSSLLPFLKNAGKAASKVVGKKKMPQVRFSGVWIQRARESFAQFLADLRDPERKRRAHLLLIAGAVMAFLLVWMVVRLSTTSQRSKTKAELEQLVVQIDEEIQNADNRRRAGDLDAANAILERARQRATEVMDNESGLFRTRTFDLLDRIRAKQEEINNIVRISPRTLVNLASKKSDVAALGIIGVSDGEVAVFDRQDVYRVLQNHIDDPERLGDEDLLVAGTMLSRFQTLVFLTSGNSVLELASGQTTAMKTDDPAGWVQGKAVDAYLRFLYVLSPETNQIYKYERLTNRYGPAVGYNVNGNLQGALDMVIDGSIFVLKEGGEVLKLFRGETQSFTIRHGPVDALKDAMKVVKIPDGNFFFLDSKHGRVIVVSDGGATGEASYLKQYVLEGEEVGTLQDLYVDPEGSRLYVLDEKRVHVIDLSTN